ncbi:MAG: hypothetical protein GY739_13370 [Mesoflavibacter sp.]|nr:hypothetical protein [Mesoflavibacter sp.]
MKIFICYFFCIYFMFVNNGCAQEPKNKTKTAIDFLLTACVAKGEKVEVEAKGYAGLTLRHWKKAGLEGEVSFRKEELSGFVDQLNSISAAQATEVRECMKPYIDKILNVILNDNQAYVPENKPYTNKQKKKPTQEYTQKVTLHTNEGDFIANVNEKNSTKEAPKQKIDMGVNKKTVILNINK